MNNPVLQGDNLVLQLSRIDQLLTCGQYLWQAPAFHSQAINEMHQRIFAATPLKKAVGALDWESLEAVDADPRLLFDVLSVALDALVPGYAATFRELDNFLLPPEEAALTTDVAIPFWLETGIGGRKLDQIRHFIRDVPELRGNVVEWCAGKGHLGRLWLYHQNTLAGPTNEEGRGAPDRQLKNDHPGTQVHSVEWQADLCGQGSQLAAQHQVKQTFYCRNVLQPLQWAEIGAPRHALALHACGDLHRALLQHAEQEPLQTLILAPCCYHLTDDVHYRPLSKHVAKSSGLRLPKAALKLAVQGQVTGGRRITKLRHTEVEWRLAYQLARDAFGAAEQDGCRDEGNNGPSRPIQAHQPNNAAKNAHQPLPNVPKALLSEDFESFFRWACRQHNWQPPASIKPSNHDLWLTQAAQLHFKLKQLDLVRHSFRRLLELWLVLDRAVYLREQGYEVTVKVFCPYTTSPRNLLISAQRN